MCKDSNRAIPIKINGLINCIKLVMVSPPIRGVIRLALCAFRKRYSIRNTPTIIIIISLQGLVKKTYEIKNIIEAQFELMRQEINVMQNSKRKPVKCIFHLNL